MRQESRFDRCFLSRHFLCWLVFGSVLTGGLMAPAQEQPPAPGFRDRTAELGLQLAKRVIGVVAAEARAPLEAQRVSLPEQVVEPATHLARRKSLRQDDEGCELGFGDW